MEGEAFAANISEEARQGTRTNLLGKQVLDAERHPFIDAELLSTVGPWWAPEVHLRMHVLGRQSELQVFPGVWQESDRVLVHGSFLLRQTDIGMEPFSVLGGGLRVADDLLIRAKLVFTAIDDVNGCMVPFGALLTS